MTDSKLKDRLYIEYMRLDDLMKRMHPKNPKDHDIGLLTSLIRDNGFKTAGAIDELTGYFAEGHGRTETLHDMFSNGEDLPKGIDTDELDGMWLVPVQRGARFETEDQLIKFYAGSNKAVMAGGWNDDLLYEALTLAFDDGSIEHVGFDDDDYQALGEVLFADDLAFDDGNATDDSPNESDSGDWTPPESNVSMVQLYFDPDELSIVNHCLKVLREYHDAPNPSVAVMNALITARDSAYEDQPVLREQFKYEDD